MLENMPVSSNFFRVVSLLMLLVVLPANAADGSVADESKLIWSLTPYIWATETKLDIKADGTPIGNDTISFGDLLDTIDTSFQIVAEGGLRDSNWSAFIDLTYLETSDDLNESIEGNPVRIKTDSEQWFVDAAVAYWPMGTGEGVNFYGGLRYTGLDDEFDISIVGTPVGKINSDRSFTDALLGVRYPFEFNDRWSLQTRGDYAFGDSDGIFLLQAAVRYAVGSKRQNGIIVGYRYKEAKFEDSGVEEDYDYSGPIAGFNFRF